MTPGGCAAMSPAGDDDCRNLVVGERMLSCRPDQASNDGTVSSGNAGGSPHTPA